MIQKKDIVFENNKMMIVNKASGVLSQSDRSFDADLVSQVLTYRKSRGEDAYAAIINRLDRPVSGLVLFAKNKKEAARLSSQMQKDSLNKYYYAICCGRFDKKEGLLENYLLKNGKTNMSEIVKEDTPGAKYARLEYEVIKEISIQENIQVDISDKHNDIKVISLVKIHLITGRHHQIRVQFAGKGLPLLGDTKYGGIVQEQYQTELKKAHKRILKIKEIALCAYSLTVDGNEINISIPWKL